MKFGLWAKSASPGDTVGTSVFLFASDKKVWFKCECEEPVSRSLSSDVTPALTCKRCWVKATQTPDWGYREVFQKMRHKAGTRNIEFHLELDDLKRLISQDCHYCGVTGFNSVQYRSKSGVTESFKYNGLDRVDSAGHYTVDNVVPCCPICNRAKGSVSYEEFMAWISRLSLARSVVGV